MCQERTLKNAERRKNKKMKKMRNKEKFALRAGQEEDSKDSSDGGECDDDGDNTSGTGRNETTKIVAEEVSDQKKHRSSSPGHNIAQSSALSINYASISEGGK